MATGRTGRQAVFIIGAGGHGKVVCDVLVAGGHRVVGWIDDAPARRGRMVCGYPVLGSRKQLPALLRRWGRSRPQFMVAIGDNRQRGRIFDELVRRTLRPATAVHPSAAIASSARLGRGVLVCAGAVVNPDARISDNVIINTSASVDHDNRLERDVHLSPGAHTGGHVRLGRGVHLGLGAVVLPDRSVGAYTIVGAGAVVDQDLPAGVVAVGVPARAARRQR